MTTKTIPFYHFELRAIEQFYGDQRAKRSGVLLINHIHEGLAILDALEAPELAYRLFCLHPVGRKAEMRAVVKYFELDDAIEEYNELNDLYGSGYQSVRFTTEEDLFNKLADQYATPAVLYALLADKIQNRKDFNLYHNGSLPNSELLQSYFDCWINALRKIIKEGSDNAWT